MAFRPLLFDNPIDLKNFPKLRLPYEFPARPVTVLTAQCRIMGSLVTEGCLFVASIVVISHYFPEVVAEYHSLLAAFTTINILCFIAAIASRPFVKGSALSDMMVILGLAISTVVLCEKSLISQYVPLVSGLLLTWSILELANHGVSVNPMPDREKTLDPRFVFVSVVTLLHTWVIQSIIFPYHTLIPALGLSVVASVLAIVQHARNARGFRSILHFGIQSYLTYPEAKDLVPGLIASPIARFVLRPMGLIQFAIVFVAGWALQAEKLVFLDVINGVVAATAIAGSLVVFTLIATAWPIEENLPNNRWQRIIKAIDTGLSKLLKDSIYAATVAADGSPVLVDRSFLLQHVHFLGGTGSGKTSMGMVPLVEQIIRDGKSSVIMLNLKGRSLEGYSAMVAAQQELLARTGQSIPIKVFSLENGVRTHIFNPLLSPAWRRLSAVEQSEILNNAYGLNFGQSYGAKWFGDSAAEFSLTSLLANPNTISFRNLLVEAQRILKSSRAGDLPPEVKRAGIHAWLLTKRMAAVDALNLTQSPLEAPDALEHQIDLTKCFTSPQLCYFNLPSMTAPNTAPAIARLVTHFLMTAGQYVENKVRVHLVIDEFQNMVSDSLEQVFAMARSLNISLILANQNMSDIHAKSRILANSIESNCHWRQWFSVKTREDIKALEELFGTREELMTSTTHTDKGSSTTEWIDDVPRVKSPDLQSISDNPNLSILHITGDRKGYGKYRGIPFVVRSEFHISKVEFERRERGPWPTDLPGMITGGTTHTPTAADESLDASDLGIDDKTGTPNSSKFQSDLFE